MELEHSFTVPVPKDRAWDVLLDVERVAPCMPGATLDSVDGDEIHGKIKVKVGPISMTYAGTARFVERDPVAGVVSLEASGKETRGAGTASASVRSVLEDRGNETHVTVLTTLNVTGKPAQFGRGVMNEVGGKLLNIFAANLAATLAAPETPATVTAGAVAPVPADAATAGPVTDGASGSVAAAAASATASLDAPLEDLTISTRLREALRRGGITTIGELVAKTSQDLLELSGIGQSSIEDIKAKLAERGLTLGQPPAAALAAAARAGAAPPDEAPAGAAPADLIPAGTVPSQPTALTVSNGSAPTGASGATAGQRQPGAAKAAAEEPEALNLLKVAGMPMLKRALPVLAGLTAAILIAMRRRLRHRRS
jgi:carbon monoxide dehydrogenase subunit G